MKKTATALIGCFFAAAFFVTANASEHGEYGERYEHRYGDDDRYEYRNSRYDRDDRYEYRNGRYDSDDRYEYRNGRYDSDDRYEYRNGRYEHGRYAYDD